MYTVLFFYIFQISNLHENSTNEISTPTSPNPILLHLAYGRIQALYASKDESSNLNIMRGLSSLFQYQSGSMEGLESDVSGECHVTYTPDRHGVHKSKTDCKMNKDGKSQRVGLEKSNDF